MSSNLIDPAAGMPAISQAFDFSDRNPVVTILGGPEADGGQIAAPAASESRVTAPGNPALGDAGLKDYSDNDNGLGMENESND